MAVGRVISRSEARSDGEPTVSPALARAIADSAPGFRRIEERAAALAEDNRRLVNSITDRALRESVVRAL